MTTVPPSAIIELAGLMKITGLVGNLVAELLNVLDVIATDADDLANRNILVAEFYGVHIDLRENLGLKNFIKFNAKTQSCKEKPYQNKVDGE